MRARALLAAEAWGVGPWEILPGIPKRQWLAEWQQFQSIKNTIANEQYPADEDDY